MKFPSQNKIMYESGSLTHSNFGLISSGGTGSGAVCLPKDLSILNRRGYASTTRKGVPLVYRVKVDLYSQQHDGESLDAAVNSDFITTMKINGCQNNWVMRNAAIKMHAARENQFKIGGIKKSDRGAYSHEIRYGYDAYNQTWLTPIDGDGNAFTGGTWDLTTLSTHDDTDVKITLLGAATTEESSLDVSQVNLAFSYLSSRANMNSDTNLENSITPTKYSIINSMLTPGEVNHAVRDDLVDEARDAQDDVPYDVFAVDDVNNDVTEPVELCRLVAGLGGSMHASAVIDVPFGLMSIKARHQSQADTDVNSPILIHMEVQSIYEMVG